MSNHTDTAQHISLGFICILVYYTYIPLKLHSLPDYVCVLSLTGLYDFAWPQNVNCSPILLTYYLTWCELYFLSVCLLLAFFLEQYVINSIFYGANHREKKINLYMCNTHKQPCNNVNFRMFSECHGLVEKTKRRTNHTLLFLIRLM